jgi:hypothetical protein
LFTGRTLRRQFSCFSRWISGRWTLTMNIAATRMSHVWVEMSLGSSDSRLSIDIISLRYDGRLWWHLSILDIEVIKILGWGH